MGDSSSGSLKMLSAIILMRTFGMPGVLAGQYHAFFKIIRYVLIARKYCNIVPGLTHSNPLGGTGNFPWSR
jgi:hypothetical protein